MSSFSGTGPDSLRFLAGGFKERNSQGGGGFSQGFTGSTEFRSTLYAASPGSALEGRLAAVDLGTDDFYATPASGAIDAAGFDCAAAADIEVALDFLNSTAQAIQQTCEQRLWERMHFCHDDPTVQAAEQAFQQHCMGPH